jgi:hypothetical protein
MYYRLDKAEESSAETGKGMQGFKMLESQYGQYAQH